MNMMNAKDQHYNRCFARLQYYYQTDLMTDMVLISRKDGTRINTHSLLLATSSDFFESAVIAHKAKASTCSNNKMEIILDDVDGQRLRGILNFIYNGDIQLQDLEVAKIYLKAAFFLGLPALKSKCKEFLELNLKVENYLGIASLAKTYQFKEMEANVRAFICEHFTEICQDKELLQLHPDMLYEILNSEGLNVNSEEEVFHVVMKWIDFAKDDRVKHLPKLLSAVKLSILSTKFLKDHVSPVCKANNCSDILIEAYEKKELNNETLRTNSKAVSLNLQVRKSDVLVLVGEYQFGLYIDKYDSLQKKWINLLSGLPRRNDFSLQSFGKKLFIMGGEYFHDKINYIISIDLETKASDRLLPQESKMNIEPGAINSLLYATCSAGHKKLTYIQQLNPKTNSWQFIKTLQSDGYEKSAIVFNKQLYVINVRHYISAYQVEYLLQRYDPQQDKWTSIKRWYSGPRHMVALNEILYVIGGNGNGRNTTAVESYDPLKSKWKPLKDIPFRFDFSPRSKIHITAVNGCIYVANRNQNIVQRYDPYWEAWFQLVDPVKITCIYSCSELNGKLIAVGPERSLKSLITEEYDPDTNTWNVLSQLPRKYEEVRMIGIQQTILNKNNVCTFFPFIIANMK